MQAPITVRLFIRGVGQNDVQVTQDPSVALYMDGVYIRSSVGTAFETADVQRIEVLRGPQGTLYGRNTTGDFHWDITDSLESNYKYEKSSIKDTSRLSRCYVSMTLRPPRPSSVRRP